MSVAHYISVALIIHAGFSTVHFKGLVHDAELVPPVDVVIEVCVRAPRLVRAPRAPADAFSLRAQVAFLLATYSSVSSLPALKPVRAVQDVSPEFQDAAFHCGEFDTVHHRGKALAARRRALGQELD